MELMIASDIHGSHIIVRKLMKHTKGKKLTNYYY